MLNIPLEILAHSTLGFSVITFKLISHCRHAMGMYKLSEIVRFWHVNLLQHKILTTQCGCFIHTYPYFALGINFLTWYLGVT